MKRVLQSLIGAGTVLTLGFGITAASAAPVVLGFDSLASTAAFFGQPSAASVLTGDFANQGLIFGRAGESAGVAVSNNNNSFSSLSVIGLEADGTIKPALASDIHFFFVDPTDGATPSTTDFVSFVIGDNGGDADIWDINLFDINDNMLSTQNVVSTTHILQTFNQAGIARVEIDFNDSSSTGYLLDNLSFNQPGATAVVITVTQAAVPLPASLPLFGAALVGLAALRLRNGART